MTSDKILDWLRMGALLYFLFAACATLLMPVGDGVKAPLLTLMGGASIVTALFPLEFRRIASVGTALGTVIAMIGSGAWFADAMQGELLLIETRPSGIEMLFLVTVIVTLAFAAISIILSMWKAIRSKSTVDSKPREGKKALIVFGTLSTIIAVLHIIRSSIDRKDRNDAIV